MKDRNKTSYDSMVSDGTVENVRNATAVPPAELSNSSPSPRVSGSDDAALLNAMPDAAWLIDLSGSLRSLNQRAADLIGAPIDNLIGKPAFELFPGDLALIRKIRFDEIVDTESPVRLQEKYHGTLLDTRMMPVYGEDARISGVAVYSRDTTNQAGIGIDLEQSTKDADNVRRSGDEELIRQYEETYRLVVENANEAICVIQNGILKFANNKAKELTGFGDEEILSRSFLDFIHPDDHHLASQEYAKRLSGEHAPNPSLLRGINKSGRIWWAYNYSIPVTWSGKSAILVFVTDVTELKSARDALDESQRILRAALDALPIEVLWKDRNLAYLGCNKAFAESVGLETPEEIVGKSDFEHSCIRERTDTLYAVHGQVMRTGEPDTRYFSLRPRTESERLWFFSHTVPLCDSCGDIIGVLSTLQDVTEGKRSQELLSASETRLELALNGADLGLWDWDIQSDTVVRDRRWADILGHSEGDIEPRQSSWKELIHPEDVHTVMERLGVHLEGRSSIYEAEYRLKTKTGGWKWVLARGKVSERGESGQPLRLTGTTLDISDRKGVEQNLLESEEKYKLLIEALPYIIAIFRDEDLVFINDFGAGILGYENPEEMIAAGAADPAHRTLREALTGSGAAHTAAEASEPAHFETVFKRRNGEQFPVEVFRTATNFRGGPAVQVVASDIGKRKEAEQELKIIGHAIESSFNATGIADLDNHLTYVNPAFLKLWGYDDPQEVLGKKVRELWAEQPKLEEVRQALEFNQGWMGELVAKRKDETFFDAQVAATVVTGETGEPVCVMASSVDITDQKRAEADLRRSRDLVEALLNGTNDIASLFDPEGTWIAVNQRAAEALDKRAEQVLGKNVFDVLPEEIAHTRRLAIKEVVETGEQIRFVEERFGTVLDTTLTPVLDPYGEVENVAVFCKDITDQKKAEQEIRESRALLQGILDASPVGIAMAESGRIVWANETMLSIFGYDTAEGFLKQDPRDLYASEEDYGKIGGIMRRGFATVKTVTTYVRFKRKDGAIIDCRLTLGTLDPANPGGRTVLTVTDMSDQRKAQEALIHAERFRAVADLASGVAHNFNNMLQIVMAAGRLALQNIDEDNVSGAKRHLEKMLEAFKFGADTVKRIQDFAGVRRENKLERESAFDLADVVGEAAELSTLWWKTNKEREGIEISLNMDLASGCVIIGRKNELFEVIVNLIRNATEALPEGGVIDVITAVNNREVTLTVKDNGIGIPRENMDRIFTPFFTTKLTFGTGLGLTTSRLIVEDHNGRLDVRSLPGSGAEFTVRLPLAEGPIDCSAPQIEETGLEPLTILLIDDMPLILELVEEALVKFGHTILTAQSGREGLAIIESGTVDLVICDLGMPGMNGWEVGARLKRIADEREAPKPPFILLTGWAEQARERHKIVDAGVATVIQKPIDISELLEAIHNAVNSN